MDATTFDAIARPTFEAASLGVSAALAALLTLRLAGALAGRAAAPLGDAHPGSARPGRGDGGREADRPGDLFLARMSLTLVPTRPSSHADELAKLGLLSPEAGAFPAGRRARIEAGKPLDRLA